MTKSLFEEIRLKYDDGENVQEYSIPADRVFGAIAVVEEFVTLKELSEALRHTGSIKLTRMAAAYAAVLRYAGAKGVSDERVYVSMFNGDASRNSIISAINGLLGLMIPPEALKRASEAAEEETGKPGELVRQPETLAAS